MKTPFLRTFLGLLMQIALLLRDPRPRPKVVDLGIGWLCGPYPKTVTSALEWLGLRQQDWTADYRLFSQDQWGGDDLSVPVFRQVLAAEGPTSAPVILAQDDTLLRKSGKRTFGTTFARDPLSPPFHVNLVRGQRFVQASLLRQPRGVDHPWRAIPLSFDLAPTLKVPRRASEAEQTAVKELRKKHRLSVVALAQLGRWREQLDQVPGGRERWLLDAVDGSYANRTFLRDLPSRTHVVARFRKDAKLRAYLPPDQRRGARKYGEPLLTPAEYLRLETLPWQAMPVWIAGQWRALHYKLVESVCWPKATKDRPLRLILIQAAGYRLRAGSKLLYREPAFLITTDLTAPVVELIAAYLGRWEIEVNFRDEKTLIGVGQAQVRQPDSVERTPQFLVACYGALLWAQLQVFGDQRTEAFEVLPRWRNQKPVRPSTRDLLRLLQKEAAGYVPLSKVGGGQKESMMRN